MSKQIFIAEIKTKSPFGFKSFYSKDVLGRLAMENADWLSIHVEPLWGGTHEDIEFYTQESGMPILAKGFHETDKDIKDSINAGADYVLVVGRIPEQKYLSQCLIEPLSLEQAYEMAKKIGDRITGMVFNSRSLLTGGPSGFAASIDAYKRNFPKMKIFQASNIKAPFDIDRAADGFIVGEHLPQFIVSRHASQLLKDYYGPY